LKNKIKENFNRSVDNIKLLIEDEQLINSIDNAVELIFSSLKNFGCIYCAGNGGSAADSQHFVAEFISKLSKDRDPIRAIALTVDTSVLTAVGNDYGFDFVFSRQLDGLGKKEDVFFGISTSGKSKNIILALEAAKKKKMSTIFLTSENVGIDLVNCDVVVRAPGKSTDKIQEAHLVIYHTICYMVEIKLINEGMIQYKN
jgi:D-sedoheptulose 7-phosphate isomerase